MLFELSPHHPASQFTRTVRVAGRPGRVCRFRPGVKIDLDAKEQQFMATEIAAGWIGPAGHPFPKPSKPPRPRLHPEEDYRDFDAEDRCRRIPRTSYYL